MLSNSGKILCLMAISVAPALHAGFIANVDTGTNAGGSFLADGSNTSSGLTFTLIASAMDVSGCSANKNCNLPTYVANQGGLPFGYYPSGSFGWMYDGDDSTHVSNQGDPNVVNSLKMNHSKWIMPANPGGTTADPNYNFSAGNYIYRFMINVGAIDPSSLILSGLWATDNSGTIILVNNVDQGAHGSCCFGGPSRFSVGGFQSGLNTIDFLVINGDSSGNPAGPTGLRVDAILQSVPEPSSLAFLGIGLAGLGVAARRKRTPQ